MPFYVYSCLKCEFSVNQLKPISEFSTTIDCPKCGSEAYLQVSTPLIDNRKSPNSADKDRGLH